MPDRATRRAAARTTLPSHAQGRGVCHALSALAGAAARLRCLAHRLQSGAPHEGLDMRRPADRFGRARGRCRRARRSNMTDDEIGAQRLVDPQLYRFKGRRWRVPQAFCRRASRYPTARTRRPLRYLLRQLAGRTIDLTDDKVSAMCPNRCQLCLRAEQKAGDPVFQSRSAIESRSRGVLGPPPHPVIGCGFARLVGRE